MFALSDVAGIINLLKRFLIFGRSDIKGVQKETEELIRDISRSLVSLHDIVIEVARLKVEEFNQEAFEKIYDYFYKFYLKPEDIDKARTHCSDLERNVGRITYKLAHVLHTDIGKWDDVSSSIKTRQYLDETILLEYKTSIGTLKEKLDEIKSKLAEGNIIAASQIYQRLKDDMYSDIEQLRIGVSTMKQVAAHVRKLSG